MLQRNERKSLMSIVRCSLVYTGWELLDGELPWSCLEGSNVLIGSAVAGAIATGLVCGSEVLTVRVSLALVAAAAEELLVLLLADAGVGIVVPGAATATVGAEAGEDC
jgi:hypothetical protein